MNGILEVAARQRLARIAGALYIIQMAVAMFGEMFVRGRLVSADPAATASAIAASETLFRISIVSDLLVYATVVVRAWAFYEILRSIRPGLALLALVLRIVENAILATSTIFAGVALKLSIGTAYLAEMDPETRHALVRLCISAMGWGMGTGFVFLGAGSAVFAFVWLRSGYIPKWVAGWGIFASSLLALGSMVSIAAPSVTAQIGLAYMIPMFLYEVGLGLLLLIRGIAVPEAAPPAASKS